MKKNYGFGFIEIMIAVILAAVATVPIFYMITSSRVDTTRAINYLRAIELANEVIEWVSVTPFEDRGVMSMSNQLSIINGSLVNAPSLDNLSARNVLVANTEYDPIVEITAPTDSITYSEQYNRNFFFREITVEPVTPNPVAPDLLKKVTVVVSWSENRVPPTPDLAAGRDRRVEMSVLVLNDRNLFY